MVLLSPWFQTFCLFLSTHDKKESHWFSDHSRSSQLVSSMWTLLLISSWSSLTPASQSQIPQELYMNRLNMSFGINYKFNGLLHQNLERVWVFTKIAPPKLEDIHFPDINFDPDCTFTRKLNNARQAAKYEIQSTCKSMMPLITFMFCTWLHVATAWTDMKTVCIWVHNMIYSDAQFQ